MTRKGNIITVNDLYEKTVEESVRIIKEKRPDYEKSKGKQQMRLMALLIRYNIMLNLKGN